MLHKNNIFHIFAMRDEAETGNAGGQLVRNNLAKLNRNNNDDIPDECMWGNLLSIWLTYS